jgi:integrase
VRKLPSGNYQVRYRGPDNYFYTAPITYPTVADADAYLATVQADMIRQTWKAPGLVTEALSTYGLRWVQERPGLKASTRHQHEIDFRRHIAPYLGHLPLDRITPDVVRSWHADLGAVLAASLQTDGAQVRRDGRATQARAYRLLHAVMETATLDGILARNPCNLPGAGSYRALERPTMSVREVEALSEAVPERHRTLVLLLAWCGLRLGEACELRRKDLDLEAGTIRVSRDVYYVAGKYLVDTTKSSAGVRTIHLPAFMSDSLRAHIRKFTDLGPDALIFTAKTGNCAYGAAQQAGRKALALVGRPDMTLHDLRHTHQKWIDAQGAGLSQVMRSMGHSSLDASVRYMHAGSEEGRALAERLHAHRESVIAMPRSS